MGLSGWRLVSSYGCSLGRVVQQGAGPPSETKTVSKTAVKIVFRHADTAASTGPISISARFWRDPRYQTPSGFPIA